MNSCHLFASESRGRVPWLPSGSGHPDRPLHHSRVLVTDAPLLDLGRPEPRPRGVAPSLQGGFYPLTSHHLANVVLSI